MVSFFVVIILVANLELNMCGCIILTIFHFSDGQFVKSKIAEFVFANKLPLVTTFTRESAPLIFESPIKKQVSGCVCCVNFDYRLRFCLK